MNSESGLPSYAPLEKLQVPRPVDRIAYVRSCCAGKLVLDLGAMDETAFMAKRGRGTWLHEEIAAVAQRVIGIDSSALVPPEGVPTASNAAIHRGDVLHLDEVLRCHALVPDVVVAGELIEHLESPLAFLRHLRSVSGLRGRTLLLTTPNATAVHNCLIGLLRRESTHHDHLCILSFKTLCTLCHRAGFEDWDIIPYASRFTEMKERNTGLRRAIVVIGEKVVNGIEWMFPMLSFGYVIRVRI